MTATEPGGQRPTPARSAGGGVTRAAGWLAFAAAWPLLRALGWLDDRHHALIQFFFG